MSMKSVCFWLFLPGLVTYFREELTVTFKLWLGRIPEQPTCWRPGDSIKSLYV